MNVKGIKIKKVSVVLFVLAVACLVLLIPAVQDALIAFAEGKMGRALNYPPHYWHRAMISYSICAFVFFVVLAVVYNVLDFPKFVPHEPHTEGFVFFNAKGKVKIFADKRFALAFFLLFVALIAVRVYWISQKKSYHEDEMMSIAISNRIAFGTYDSKFSNSKPYETNRLYAGKELKEITHWDNDSFSDVLSDLAHLYVNNNGDNPHCNFYYSLLRVWFAGVKTYDFKEIVWQGCGLNLLIFAFSYWFMFALLSRFTQDKANILLCLFVSFFNPHTISSTLFIRPYELQTCLFILFALLFTDSFEAIFNNEQHFESKHNFVLGAFLTALFLLTGYFSLIFTVFLGLALLLLCFKKQRKDSADFLVWMFVLSIVFARILFFGYGLGLIGGQGITAISKFSPSVPALLKNLSSSILGLTTAFVRKNVFLAVFSLLCLILIALHIYYFTKNKNKTESFVCKFNLLCCVILFCFVTLYFAPWKNLRYIVPVFPLFSLLFVSSKKEKLISVAAVFACLCLFISVLPIWKQEIERQRFSLITLIEHIDDHCFDEIDCVKDESIPLIIKYTDTKIKWKMGTIIPYVQDDQKVFFIDEMSELDAIKDDYGKVWLCIDRTIDIESFSEIKFNIVCYNDLHYYREFLID